MIDLHETIENCLNKDNKAYTALYDSMYSTVFKTCMRYAPNEMVANDYIQECYIKIFDKLHLFIGDTMAELGAWVKKVCINYCIDQARGFKPTFCEQVELSWLQSEENESEIQNNYTLNEIMNAIHKLSPRYKTVFNMFVLDGYTHDEITRELGLNPGASKANLFKAKKKVKEILLATK